jgi:hypothetical protein
MIRYTHFSASSLTAAAVFFKTPNIFCSVLQKIIFIVWDSIHNVYYKYNCVTEKNIGSFKKIRQAGSGVWQSALSFFFFFTKRKDETPQQASNLALTHTQHLLLLNEKMKSYSGAK